MAQEIIEIIDKWDCTKLKNFCTANEIINWMKKKIAYKIGENLYQLFTQKSINIQNILTTQKFHQENN
jgi:hypothetical protein